MSFKLTFDCPDRDITINQNSYPYETRDPFSPYKRAFGNFYYNVEFKDRTIDDLQSGDIRLSSTYSRVIEDNWSLIPESRSELEEIGRLRRRYEEAERQHRAALETAIFWGQNSVLIDNAPQSEPSPPEIMPVEEPQTEDARSFRQRLNNAIDNVLRRRR